MSLHPEVLEAMAQTAARGGNPASQHQLGQAARRAVDVAARDVARLVGLDAADVVWAATAAEAVLLGLQAVLPRPAGARVALAANEAFAAAARVLEAWGAQVVDVAAWPANDAAPLGALGCALGPRAADGALAAHEHAVLRAATSAGVAAVVELSATLQDAAARQGRGGTAPVPLRWPQGATPRAVAFAGAAIGGPPGVAALVLASAPPRAGTVPRELAVGLGVAARRLAIPG